MGLRIFWQSRHSHNVAGYRYNEPCTGIDDQVLHRYNKTIRGAALGKIVAEAVLGFCDADGNMYPEVAAALKSIPQGAATTIWCATSTLLNEIGGVYCEDCDIAELDLGQFEKKFDEPSSLKGVQPYSVDKDNAQRLWKLSEEMTGITFRIN